MLAFVDVAAGAHDDMPRDFQVRPPRAGRSAKSVGCDVELGLFDGGFEARADIADARPVRPGKHVSVARTGSQGFLFEFQQNLTQLVRDRNPALGPLLADVGRHRDKIRLRVDHAPRQKGRLPVTHGRFPPACERAPATTNVYCHGLKLEEPDAAQLKAHAERFADAREYEAGSDTEQSPVVVVNKVASGITLPGLTAIDFPRAVTVVNSTVDIEIRKRAAAERLDALAVKSQGNKSRDEIEREHRGLSSAALTGVYSEEALRDLLWPQSRE